jgi:acyl-CoA synthetase (AMP-forming)/AMP-acid ligase II
MLLSDIPAIAAHHAPNRIAIRFEGRTLTYTQLRDRCWCLSHALAEVASPGDRVAILAENCPAYVEAYYGVPGARMGLTLLNYRLAPRELAYIIGNSEPRVLFVEQKYLPTIELIRGDIPSVETVVVLDGIREGHDSYERFLQSGEPVEPELKPLDSDLCWLIYTSETTGLPKGAMLSHANVVGGITNSMVCWDNSTDDIAMFTFPMFHVAGYVMPMYHLRGFEVVLMRNFDPAGLLSSIQEFGVTSTAMAPTMIAMLLEDPQTKDYDLSSLKRIGYGAAAMPLQTLRKARAAWPGIGFSTGFGMTELSGNVMYMGPEDHDRAAENGLEIIRSVGRQMPMGRVRIVDDHGDDVPVGQEGEIVIQGDQVLGAYWKNPEATKSAFFGRWFRSGDVGRWDQDGYLYIVDRKKDMILTGGENVYPREVEDVLYQHPAIVEVAVIGIPDPKWGESVVAVITPRAGSAITPLEVIAHCREQMASYKKPKHVVWIDTLPKNASGKILKRELRDRIATGDLKIASDDQVP